ncbi:hypothetical protein EV215_1574 [Hypnocyclicus thermotrophus]|uniref:Uncharacterized protein n=1 Tax=Hypnocyclicus thermotrophus TaxID=1627895 RepID=A0AA46DY27_9FUSO|nr:hypothetical protein [Hypnocyclicus thermotrophus]TDT69231.1 hypothetical protein EV215_1574 [Hypnocyclicus thermotrophus]
MIFIGIFSINYEEKFIKKIKLEKNYLDLEEVDLVKLEKNYKLFFLKLFSWFDGYYFKVKDNYIKIYTNNIKDIIIKEKIDITKYL